MSEILEKAGFKGTKGEWFFVQNAKGEVFIVSENKNYASGHQTICKVFRDDIKATEVLANVRIIEYAKEMTESLLSLQSILCNPEGEPCFRGSIGDLNVAKNAFKIINKALNLPKDGQ